MEQLTVAKSLIERGVNRDLAGSATLWLTPQVIQQTIAWYDSQGERVGPGVLVAELRKGGVSPGGGQSQQAREEAYGEQSIDWLREHFPQWNREEGNRTHTAAIACVIRLHHQHGRGRLSVREHGPEIRQAVAHFEQEYGSAGEER